MIIWSLPYRTVIHGNLQSIVTHFMDDYSWPEVTRVGMGFFCCPDDGEWGRGGCYIVARYDRPQIGGQTAWRPSMNNPFGVQGQTDHEHSTWNEEE